MLGFCSKNVLDFVLKMLDFADGTSITGQCWSNLTGGTWFSLQKPGECKNGASIGTKECEFLH